MRATEQAPGLSILDHGRQVRDFYRDLIAHLRTGSPLRHPWRLPDWIFDPKLIDRLAGDRIMARYHLFHDCGKPETLTIDADGRRHFPNHAEASASAWARAGGDPEIGRLIAMDMDIHRIKDADCAEFAARPEACSLILTGLAEIHANAAMFGGLESQSFKMKWKQIDRRGKAILKLL
jgi:hypothetical protein